MNKAVFLLLKNNIDEIKSKKKFMLFLLRECIFIYGIVFILKNLINVSMIDINVYYTGIFTATCISSIIYIYSLMVYSKENKLMNILPILKRDLFIFFRTDIFIKIFLTKFLPIILSIGIFLKLNNNVGCMEILKMIFCGLLTFGCAVSLSFIAVLYCLNKEIIKAIMAILLMVIFTFSIKYISLYYGVFLLLYALLHFASYKIFMKIYKYFVPFAKRKVSKRTSLIRREFKKFFNDKVLVANYLVVIAATALFTGNLLLGNVSEYPIISLMLILPLSSCTTSSLYSYEGEKIKLIKMLPIKFYRIVLSECIVCISLTSLIYIGALGALYFRGMVSIEYCLLYLLEMIFICVYKVFIDINNPVLDFKHTDELLRNPRKYKMFVKIIIAYMPVILYSCCSIWLVTALMIVINVLLILLENKRNIKIERN